MPTNNPRIQVTLDEKTNGILATISKEKDLSVSATAANLIKDALEMREDIFLSELAETRDNKDTKWVSHDDAWK